MKAFSWKSRILHGITIFSSLFASLFVVFALSQVKPAAVLTSRLRWRRREKGTPVSTSPSSSAHTDPQQALVSPVVEMQPQQVTTTPVVKRSPQAVEYQRRLAQAAWEREQRFSEPEWD